MLKKAGLMAAGVVVGLVITGVLMEQERRREEESSGGAEKKNGLYAEISGSTVRLYELKDGHFCGYTTTKVFENRDKAMEWAVKETDAKLIIKEEGS